MVARSVASPHSQDAGRWIRANWPLPSIPSGQRGPLPRWLQQVLRPAPIQEKARFRSPAIQRLRRRADNGSVATFVPRTSPGALAAPDAASSLAYPTRDRQGPTGTLYCRDHASGARRVSRRLGRADQSFRQAPRQLSLRQDRSTAQPLLALALHGRATPRLRSKSMAFLVLARSPVPCSCPLYPSLECLKTRWPGHLLTILHERSRRMKPKSRSSSRKIERVAVRSEWPLNGEK